METVRGKEELGGIKRNVKELDEEEFVSELGSKRKME